MKRMRITCVVASAVGILFIAPAVSIAAASVVALSDGGFFEHVYSNSGTPYVDTIQFVWIPEGPPGATEYGISGYCTHTDLNLGIFSGTYKAAFRQLTMVGVDSGDRAEGINKQAKIRNGQPTKYALWDFGSVGAGFASSDSAVLVTARVKVKGQVRSGSYLQCYLGVIEGDASLFETAASAAERMVVFEELARLKFDPRPIIATE